METTKAPTRIVNATSPSSNLWDVARVVTSSPQMLGERARTLTGGEAQAVGLGAVGVHVADTLDGVADHAERTVAPRAGLHDATAHPPSEARDGGLGISRPGGEEGVLGA